MPVQLNGVSGWAGRPGQNGEVTPEKSKKSNRRERVENLKSGIEKLDAGVAKGKLIALRDHIEGAPRNGFLRLDGGGRSGDVSFSTHSWKGWGKSAKGEVTGEALRTLFKQAGYDTWHLDKYLGTRGQEGYRGNQRVELGQLRAIMTNTGIGVPEENAGKAPDTSWKTWLPVDLKYSADPETLAKMKSSWEGDEKVKGDGVQVKVEEEATRFKKVAGERNIIDGTFNTADNLYPEFRGLDLVFAKDMTRGNGTSLCQLEGKPDNLVNIPKKEFEDKEQADLFQRDQANDYFGFFRNEFPNNPEKAEKWATLASCFLHQGTSHAALIPQMQKGIISSDLVAGGTENFTLKIDPGGDTATLTVETKGVPVNISSASGFVQVGTPDEAAKIGIDLEASSRSQKLVLRITLDDSQPVGADPNKLLGDLDVISFDYEHHLAMLPDSLVAPEGVIISESENDISKINKEIEGTKLSILAHLDAANIKSEADLGFIDHRKATADSVTKEQVDLINAKFLGGGNILFNLIYEEPGILDEGLSDAERENQFRDKIQPKIEEFYFKGIEDFREKFDVGDFAPEEIDQQVEVYKSSIELYMGGIIDSMLTTVQNTAEAAVLRNFIANAKENQLSSGAAMDVLRALTVYQKADGDQIKSQLGMLLQNRLNNLSDLQQLATLFPSPSS